MSRTRLHYGDLRSQVGDLWLPFDASNKKLPVVVLIHGGFWRSIYTKALMNSLARAIAQEGWAVWNVDYRGVGPISKNGWPNTFVDIGAAVDYIAELDSLDSSRVVTCGHSAGGHLALWAAARDQTPPGTPGSPSRIQPCGAISLAGIVDLQQGAELGLGNNAVQRFLGGTFEQVPERYLLGSPASLLPFGIPQVLVHGLNDDLVPPSMGERYCELARAAGDNAIYEPIKNFGHREFIDPQQPSWPVIKRHIERLTLSASQ